MPELLVHRRVPGFPDRQRGFSTGTIGTSGQGLIANLTVTYDVTPRATLYLNATNLFDSRFEPVNGYQTPGPGVIAGMRVRL